MILEQGPPFRGGSVPSAAQPYEPLHLPDRHARLAQAQQESDPVQVRRRIPPLPASSPGHGSDQSGALVVAQRVHAQTHASGDFGNAQKGFHGQDRRSSSAVEVKRNSRADVDPPAQTPRGNRLNSTLREARSTTGLAGFRDLR